SNKSKLTMTKHIPTIADGGLSEYFEPNTASEIRYGRTVTWHVRPVHLKKHYSIGPRPECIHKSQTLLDIELPIEIRK
ncbi:MAG: hypothetical protein OEW87_08995, partial [Flavobacteriaceae bacterium]|nr:hypothetical protein [Flavobacteriaceae bacterium]